MRLNGNLKLEAEYHAFVDGSCLANPGPGGWGVLLKQDSKQSTFSGGEAYTTNNRMELTAAIRALERVPDGSRIMITTDSQYLKQGITQWIHTWRAKGWKTSNRSPVKNKDLWQALLDQAGRHEVRWFWIRGHSGHPGNEKADLLARTAAEKMRGKAGA